MDDIARAYRDILTRDDVALEGVFASLAEVPDLFALLHNSELHARPVMVFDDRARFPRAPSLRRWRATMEIIGVPADSEIAPRDGEMLVLADNGFPAGVALVPADLVCRPEPNSMHSAASRDGFALLKLMASFVAGYRSLTEQGGRYEDICNHPRMREIAGSIHAQSVKFSASYHEGMKLGTASVAPPRGARQLAPALWLERNARPGIGVALPPLSPVTRAVPHRPTAARPRAAGLGE